MTKEYVFCQKCCHFLEDKFFTGELQWFFRKVREHFNNHNEIIGSGDIELEITKHNENSKVYEDEWKLIAENPNFSFDKIKKELTGFIRANEFISVYQEASQLFNAGSHKNAYEFTKDRLGELLKKDFEDSKITKFGDSEWVCDQAASQSRNAIPTGIHFIDEAMLGGLMPQTWTTFLGGSNVGKSMLCPNLAYHAAKAGKKVFVTVHEDEEIPTKIRYLSRFSGVPINYLSQLRSTWSPEVALRVKEADTLLEKFVRIQFMYGQDCFIENVEESARNQKIEWGFDELLCDYGQCLKSRKYKELSDRYGLQEYIYSELKQICLELSITNLS
jgi:replicative DNA helicase